MLSNPFFLSLGLNFYYWSIPFYLLSLLFEFATEKSMSELVTKVSSSSAPPVIPSTMTIQHDNVHVQMTSNKLDGMNYSGWSQFVKLYVTGKGKLRYLIGGKRQPAISDSFSLLGWRRMPCWCHGFLIEWLQILVPLSFDFLPFMLFTMMWLKHILMIVMLVKFMNLGTGHVRLDNKGSHWPSFFLLFKPFS